MTEPGLNVAIDNWIVRDKTSRWAIRDETTNFIK